MNNEDWSEMQKKYWAETARRFSEDMNERVEEGMSPTEDDPSVVAVHTEMGSYPDFEEMLKNEGEPEFYEVEWSNGELTNQFGELLGRVDENDNTTQTAPSYDKEPQVEYKTYAYKAHKRCRKCGTILYSTVRDFSGGTVQRSPHTHYFPAFDQLRKQCGDCGYAWYELPKDYRDKSNG
tara:strand:- start:304 stop:840 length:537 start_codon:yes stop_codon:yes gene_type:complete